MTIVIIGCGIIGVSTAYHLLELGFHPEQLHLVESSDELFAGASGYAGGFLASNWYSQSVLPLGRLSFELHRELALKHGGREQWAYAPSTGLSLSLSEVDDTDASEQESGVDWLLQGTSRADMAHRSNTTQNHHKNGIPKWLRAKPSDIDFISDVNATAQVNPLRLCQFLLESCRSRGIHLHQPCSVERLMTSNTTQQLTGLLLADGREISCQRVVVTAGPWTSQVVTKLLPKSTPRLRKLRIGHLSGHSITVRSPQWQETAGDQETNELGCHAVFATSFTTADSEGGSHTFTPEIFSRHPDEIYIAGLNDTSAPLPTLSHERLVDPNAIAALKEVARRIVRMDKNDNNIEVVREGFCFRPTTDSGRPFITRLPDDILRDDCRFEAGGGIWLSAGHGPWGISLSQGTGRVLAEMILGRKPSISTQPFSL